MAHKTPISLLQELCVQQGMTPDYKLMSVEGAVHAPTFMYRVQVGEVVATATGPSKKKAKHAVAHSVLEKLLTAEGGFEQGFESDGIRIDSSSLKELVMEPIQCDVPEDNSLVNSVGMLQELCMKRRWQPPHYDTKDETGLPHERIFTISCFVENFEEIGTGKSKKLAKRQAADLMLKRLDALKPMDDIEVSEEKNGEVITNSKSPKCQPSVKTLYSQNVQDFLNQLKESTSSCLTTLAGIDLTDDNLDFDKLLDDICLEQDFTVSYTPIQERGKSGDYHCLVCIKSLPVAVCFGSGLTRELAKANSSRNALYFIQLMCRK